MSKLTQNRLIFYVLGTFTGAWVLGMVRGIGRRG